MKEIGQFGLLRVRSGRIRSVRGSRDRAGAARQTIFTTTQILNKTKNP